MKYPLIALGAVAVLATSVVLAGSGRNDISVSAGSLAGSTPGAVSPATSGSREAALQAAAALGWRVEKIRADNGYWEIKGFDASGWRIKAKLDPVTLQVVKLRHKDDHHDRDHHDRDDDDRGDGGRARGTAPPSIDAAPSGPAGQSSAVNAAPSASRAANPLYPDGNRPVVSVK